MTMVLILRVLSIVAGTLGVLLVSMAVFDPTKSAIDVLARAVIWTIVTIVAWSQSMTHQRLDP